MSEGWKIHKFGELFDSASGLSKSRDQFGYGSPFVTFKDVFYNYFLPAKLGEKANTNQREQLSCSVKKGDIFLTRTSETINELGMSSVALKDYSNATFNGFCKRLRLKENIEIKIDPVFIGYYLRSRCFRNEVTKHSTMTTRASLNNTAINSLTVILPSFSEQTQIGEILKPLDDKIELNLQMNKTLEKMAMALYKNWFVNFGPFQDGEFVESELGMIPKGWEVKKIGDLYQTTSGGTPSRNIIEYYEQGNIPWVKSKELYGSFVIDTEEKITEVGLKRSSAKLIPSKSILLAMYGATVGEASILSINATCNQAICAIIEKEISYMYIYLFLKFYKSEILNYAVGSAQQNISQEIIKHIKIVRPPRDLSVFKDLESLYDQIEQNLFENRSLSDLRNTILPKLISGEVRVNEAEQILEEVI